MSRILKNILISFVIVAFICGNKDVFADEYVVNIAVVGAIKSGKTTLVERLLGNVFCDKYSHTKKVESRFIRVNEEGTMSTFKLRFLDAPGYCDGEKEEDVKQEVFDDALEKSNFALVVIDITSDRMNHEEDEFRDPVTEAFQDFVYNIVHNKRCKNCIVIIVGTHSDEASEEQKAVFQKRVFENLAVMPKQRIGHCCMVTSLWDEKSGREGLMEYIKQQLSTLDKSKLDHFTEKEEKCCICGTMFECRADEKEEDYCKEGAEGKQQYYCLAHRSKMRERKCPGCGRMFDPSDEKSAMSPNGEIKFCDEDCMRIKLSVECDLDGCTNRVQFDNHRFDVQIEGGKVQRYCCEAHMLELHGDKCELHLSKNCKGKVLPKETRDFKKSKGKSACAPCRKLVDRHPEYLNRHFCACEGVKQHVIEDVPVIGKDGKKEYCSRYCKRRNEGECCDREGCNRKFLKDDAEGPDFVPQVVDKPLPGEDPVTGSKGEKLVKVRAPVMVNDSVTGEKKHFCCLSCKLQAGYGRQCDAGVKCIGYIGYDGAFPAFQEPDRMVSGITRKYKDKKFCCEECRRNFEGK